MENIYKTTLKSIESNTIEDFNKKCNEIMQDGYVWISSPVVIPFISFGKNMKSQKLYFQQFSKTVKDE